MINDFRAFQYCVTFAREAFRAGILSREEFAARLYRLGYQPSEVRAEENEIRMEEANKIAENIYL